LLYALPPHTTHVLQPAELPFAQLKKRFNDGCDRLRNENGGEVVTKHTFAKVLGPAYISLFTPTAISNAFKATGIWPFNPDAINPDRLDPSLATEQFDSPTPAQQLQVTSDSESSIKRKADYTRVTRAKGLQLLMEENLFLDKKVED